MNEKKNTQSKQTADLRSRHVINKMNWFNYDGFGSLSDFAVYLFLCDFLRSVAIYMRVAVQQPKPLHAFIKMLSIRLAAKK